MSDLIITDIEPETIRALERTAMAHGLSRDEFLRHHLELLAETESRPILTRAALARPLSASTDLRDDHQDHRAAS